MTVSVRPGRPNAAASGLLGGIVRERLAGERAVCPAPGETRVALSSPRQTLEGLLRAPTVSGADGRAPITFALPALELTVADMVAALEETAGVDAVALID